MYNKVMTLIALLSLLVGCGSSPATTGDSSNSGSAASEKPVTLVQMEETKAEPEDGYVTIPGTSLSFAPVGDFQQASGFVSYESLTHQTSILVMELPVPDGTQAINYFDNLFTADTLQTKGLELVSKEILHTAKKARALLLKCSLVKDGFSYTQWIYLLESEEQKIGQIQVAAPEEQFTLIEDQITNMLASFRWVGTSSESDTYYSLDLPTDWKLSKQYGLLELYSKGGVFPVPAGEPALGVTNLQQTVLAEDRQAFLDKMNLQRNYYSELKVIDSKDVEIHGHPANISYVSGIETETSKSVIKQYCYIFLDETVIFIEADQSDELNENEFEKIVLSWKLK
ncbi:hypothetical protein [Paenibacillus sp. MSJ-34]|uniref:hypothetical protein n=1 Tax=Paenibacillus sp. MSJ-34 TaxID=2841529 RepID=UPI001C119160|nr:hypothetical protein [Paenibacillus sp. MSJ-34]MBU5443493.1 hypothetical protein [Paenibacillus sp. MSJ-34]